MNETEGFPDHREAGDWSQRLASCLPRRRGRRTLINKWIPGVASSSSSGIASQGITQRSAVGRLAPRNQEVPPIDPPA